jgi:importin subunit alpha-6/7
MSDTSRYIPEHRRQQHKGRNQFRGDELRRRREDQQVEIRKQKKEENLAKRRNLDSRVQEWDGASGDTSESDDDNGTLNRKVTNARPATLSHQNPMRDDLSKLILMR